MTISPPLFNFETVEQTGSTNSDLLGRPFQRTPQAPIVLMAYHQTAGRGRRGRAWHSSQVDRPAGSLTFSLAMERHADAREPLTALSLVVGLCIMNALRTVYPLEAAALKVKWPNDLVVVGPDASLAKVGGILIETKRVAQVQRIVSGVGINLFGQTAHITDHEASYQLHSLLSSAPNASQLRELARYLGTELLQTWTQFELGGWLAFRDMWTQHDALLGQQVTIIEADDAQWHGQHLGLDDDGQLRVMTSTGERRVLVGDVSLRSQTLGGF